MKSVFNVEGMSCASCQVHVEQAVNKLPGIKSATVSLLTNELIVESKDAQINAATIISAVERAGYHATAKINLIDAKKKSKIDKQVKKSRQQLLGSAIFTVIIFYLAMGAMLSLPLPMIFLGLENSLVYAFTQFLLLIPVIYLNQQYFYRGFKALWHLKPNMNSLIALGSSAAILYGIFAIFQIGWGLGHGDMTRVQLYAHDLYFETAAMILTLVSLGKYIEERAKDKTKKAFTKLLDLAPKTALIYKNNQEIEILASEVQKGDIVIIKKGMLVPVDGIIINGRGSFNQSNITGESLPVYKEKNAQVISATLLVSGYVEIQAEKVGQDTTIATIIKLMKEAASSKAPISQLADKISAIFVPIVLSISLIASIAFLIADYDFALALSIGITVLVISCPCALGLATPLAIMVGSGKAAQNGLLIKNAEALEKAHLVKTIVLDKTGTMTVGEPSVVDVIGEEQEQLLALVAGLETTSEHPLAQAILKHTQKQKITPYKFSEFHAIEGEGLMGVYQNRKYYVGNFRMLEKNNLASEAIKNKADLYANNGKTPLFFFDEDRLLGIITINDPLKKDSVIAIQRLHKMGIRVIMLTGDNELTAQAIASEAGIDQIIANVLPSDKLLHIQNLRHEANGLVAMVGDGVNDAPALAQADLGIAIGAGSDVAHEASDIILIQNSLADVVSALRLSKRVINNIKLSLFWAFFYNSIGLILATGLLYPTWGIRLNPMIGAAAMSLSSIFVVFNALTINFFKKEQVNIDEKNRN